MTARVRSVSAASTAAGSSSRASSSTSADDGLGGGDEGVRGDDDLVARADADGAERDLEAVGAVGDADAVPRAHELGVLLLEGGDRLAADEVARGQDLGEALV